MAVGRATLENSQSSPSNYERCSGYHLDNVARDMHAFIEAQQLADCGGVDFGGHDIGTWIGRAVAAKHPATPHPFISQRSELYDIFAPRNDDRLSAFGSAGSYCNLLLSDAEAPGRCRTNCQDLRSRFVRADRCDPLHLQ